MHTCLIPPIPELDTYGRNSMHLILAHLCTDARYFKHYQTQADFGSHLLLDNGAYEHGESTHTMNELVELALAIGACEIVVPDVLRKGQATIDATTKAMDELASSETFTYTDKLQLCYIPQGETFDEWKRCLDEQVRIHCSAFGSTVDFIVGISRLYENDPGGRMLLLDQLLHGKGVTHLHTYRGVHLFGWGTNLPELAAISSRYGDHVRSVDTAKPFKYAIQGMTIGTDLEPSRGPNYFQTVFDDATEELVKKNIRIYRDAAAGQWPPTA